MTWLRFLYFDILCEDSVLLRISSFWGKWKNKTKRATRNRGMDSVMVMIGEPWGTNLPEEDIFRWSQRVNPNLMSPTFLCIFGLF